MHTAWLAVRSETLDHQYPNNYSKQKEETKKSDTAKGRTTLSSPSHRSLQLEKVEKPLHV